MLRRISRFFSVEDVNKIIEKLQLKDTVSKVSVQDTVVGLELKLDRDYRKKRAELMTNIKSLSWVTDCKISIAQESKPANVKENLSKIKNIIAVSSCKGGVGKSTVAVNLAFSIAKKGYKVGIYDADIYGPSLPTLVSVPGDLESPAEDPKQIIPKEFQGVKLMSFGFASSNRAVMRGPIVTGLTNQLLQNTMWGELDYLVIDTPPGTGDINLTLGQELPISSAVIVTTPQKLSFIDVVKGIGMFDDLKVPTVAAIQNMSYLICDSCSKKHYLFGVGYVNLLKSQFGITNSFELPIEPDISKYSDVGAPLVLVQPDSSLTVQIFNEIAKSVLEETEKIKNFHRPEVSYSSVDMKITYKSKDIAKEIDAYKVRLACRCAACVDEFSGVKLFKTEDIPKDVYPLRIEPKGNYAVAMVWSDGHRTSLYPYAQLESIV